MSKKLFYGLIISFVSLVSASAWGAGFGINEMGARSMSMANAVTAIADNPSAIFFNPAGLATQPGLNIELGMSLITPSFGYSQTTAPDGSVVEANAQTRTFPVPNLYASYQAHERITLGLGIYAPFGLGVTWPDTVNVGGQQTGWWGRSIVREIDLQTVFINPTVAFKLSDRIFIGGGVTVVHGTVKLERSVTFNSNPADDVHVNIAGEDYGFGGTAGLLVVAVPNYVHLGFTYRSAVAMNFTGNGAFTDSNGDSSGVPAGLRSRLQDGRVAAGLTLPHTFSFGIAAFPNKRLKVSFNLDVTTWSKYQELRVDFLDNPELTSAEPKLWRDSVAIRLGAEYQLLKNLYVRGGLIFDQSPAPDTTVGPELTDADRYEVTFGVGYNWDFLRFDAGYLFLVTGDNDAAASAPLPGRYGASAHVFGFSVRAEFGAEES